MTLPQSHACCRAEKLNPSLVKGFKPCLGTRNPRLNTLLPPAQQRGRRAQAGMLSSLAASSGAETPIHTASIMHKSKTQQRVKPR